MKRQIDFIIIGAQKSGTTSLFHYLKHHPDLYLLPEKEGPFFSRPEYATHGFDWYLRSYFGDAPRGKLWGKATPHYMADMRVPGRLRATLPEVRLIALLRNPVDRAQSHFRMLSRRHAVTGDFASLVDRLSRPEAAEEARGLEALPSLEPACVLAWGEYGRVLEQYLRYFPRERLLVLFTDDLAERPQSVYCAVLEFLGVPASSYPANLGERYHRGGRRQRWPWMGSMIRSAPGRALLRLMPGPQKRRLRRWIWMLNIREDPPDAATLDPGVREELRRYYLDDVRRLERILGRAVPWPEFADADVPAVYRPHPCVSAPDGG